jgi:hypothetical protein
MRKPRKITVVVINKPSVEAVAEFFYNYISQRPDLIKRILEDQGKRKKLNLAHQNLEDDQ